MPQLIATLYFVKVVKQKLNNFGIVIVLSHRLKLTFILHNQQHKKETQKNKVRITGFFYILLHKTFLKLSVHYIVY